MKLLSGIFLVCSAFFYFVGCGDPQLSAQERAIDAAASASGISLGGQVVCNKSMPPECNVDGKAIQTSKTGIPLKDSNGNYIFK